MPLNLPPMPRLDPANGVVMARRITHIDPGPVRTVSNVPSTEGTLAERLASYSRWAARRPDYVTRREGILLDIIGELLSRVEALEGTQQV
jgi:hypothetical protein